MTINLDVWLGVIANGLTIALGFSAMLRALNSLQRDLWMSKQHLDSHCQQLNHISEHLRQRDGYEPIYKLRL